MATANDVARARREGELFGIPLGDLGWFQSLLMGVAAGMAAFFLTTFVAIVALLIYSGVAHPHAGLRADVSLCGLSGGGGGDGAVAGISWRAVVTAHGAEGARGVGCKADCVQT